MRLPSYTKQLKAAVKLARIEDPSKIGRVLIEGTPYRVRVGSIRLMPRGGPQRAFAYWYSIVDDTDRVIFGAIDRADSFVSLASPWIACKLASVETLNAWAADGWKVAKDELEARG